MNARLRMVLAALLGLSCLEARPAASHVPHDQVVDFDSSRSTAVAVIRTQYLISRDAGLTWERQTRGISCPRNIGYLYRSVAISPDFEDDGAAFLTCGRRVFMSRDGGSSYSELATIPQADIVELLVSPDFASDNALLALLSDGALFSSSDGGASWARAEGAEDVTAISWTGGMLLAGDADGSVLISADGARTWQSAGEPVASSAITAFSLPNGPDLGQPIFVGTENDGVLHLMRQEGGITVSASTLEDRRITSLSHSASGGRKHLFASTWDGGIFRSADLGETWEHVSEGLQYADQADEFGQPHFRLVHATEAGEVFAGTFAGLYRSRDAGDRWFRLDTTIGFISSVVTSPPQDDTYELAVVTYASGILRSRDLGETWAYDQSGIHARRLSLDYAPTPVPGQRVFSGTYDQIDFSPGDGGPWSSVSLRNLSELYDTSFPAAPSTIALSPRYSEDGTLFLGMFPHGVVRSTDFGTSYEIVLDGEGQSWSLAISPAFADDRTIFANVGGSVFRSTDRGDTWQGVWELDVDRVDLAMSPAYADDETIFAGAASGLYWTRDGGSIWEPIALPGDNSQVVGLAVSQDLEEDGLIYVQLKGEDLLVGQVGEQGFEWRVADIPPPGHEFSPLAGQDSYDLLAFSPFFEADRTMYGGAGQYLLRSTDAGLTWEAMDPLPRRFEAEYSLISWFHVPIVLDGLWKVDTPHSFTETWSRRAVKVWRRLFGGAGWAFDNQSGTGALESASQGAALTFDFVGNGLQVIGTKGPDHGIADIYLDGELRTTVDLYASETRFQTVLFADRGLALAGHTLRVEVRGERGGASEGTWVEIDAIDTFH